MTKYLLLAAAVAAMGLAGAAYAGEAHPGKAAKPVQMTDEQMDKVTAGQGNGINTALANDAVVNNAAIDRREINAEKLGLSRGVLPGNGVCTAGPGRNC
jgi:hypothetical protein